MELHNWVIHPQEDLDVVVVLRGVPAAALPPALHLLLCEAQGAAQVVQGSEVGAWEQTHKELPARRGSAFCSDSFEVAEFVMFWALYNCVSFTKCQLKTA